MTDTFSQAMREQAIRRFVSMNFHRERRGRFAQLPFRQRCKLIVLGA